MCVIDKPLHSLNNVVRSRDFVGVAAIVSENFDLYAPFEIEAPEFSRADLVSVLRDGCS